MNQAHLQHTTTNDTTFTDTTMKQVDLEGAILTNCTFNKVDLTRAKLDNAQLAGYKITKTNLDQIKTTPNTKFENTNLLETGNVPKKTK